MVCCRGFLEARASAVAGKGLFTTHDIRTGSFIGFYCGTELEETSVEASRAGPYAMEVAPGVIIDARPNEHPKDLLGYINEPPAGAMANLVIVPYFLNARLHALDGPMAVAMAFYAARPVPAKTELLVHYGPGYEAHRKHLGYKVGRPAPSIPTKALENPRDVMSFLPLDCFVSLERQRPAPNASRRPARKASIARRGEGRPRGRPPKGKVWDAEVRRYV